MPIVNWIVMFAGGAFILLMISTGITLCTVGLFRTLPETPGRKMALEQFERNKCLIFGLLWASVIGQCVVLAITAFFVMGK